MALAEQIFQNPQLDGGPFYWKAGRTGVLLLHGLTATTTDVRQLGKFLHAQGYTVAGPLLPGHGTHPDELAQTKWQRWLQAADDAYQGLLLQCDRVFIGGVSMGGLLTLYLASQYGEIPGIMLYAPAFRIRGIWRAGLIAPFIRSTHKRKGERQMDWKGYQVNPTAAVVQLARLQKAVRKRIHLVTQPALILQGSLDQTVDPAGAYAVYEGIQSQVKSIHLLEDSTHVLLLDREFDRAAELTLNFIKTTLEL